MSRRRSLVVVWLVLGFVVAGCGAPDSGLLPPPSSTSSTSTVPVTQPIDQSLVALETFPGQTTSTVPLDVGRSTIRGSVAGPDGGAAGAVVRVERLVGDVVQRRDVVADEGGGYVLSGVPGGRYRVRAFLAPRLTMLDPEVFFLEDGGDKQLDLRTEVFEGLAVTGATNPAQPIVGQGVNLAIRVAQRSVDGDGIGREVPVPGVEVRLRSSGFAELDRASASTTTTSADPDSSTTTTTVVTSRVTDTNGVIVFSLACERVGPTTATAVVVSGDAEETFSIEVPACAPVPTTTTAAPETGDASTTTEP
ncbi:hypothetical protein [Actinospongicola halichondriae]|uniref:hypothetical protein n=1 Tax=Actinospongicola halichondriae TaxID=3236844 RepID=UPI003D5A5AF7